MIVYSVATDKTFVKHCGLNNHVLDHVADDTIGLTRTSISGRGAIAEDFECAKRKQQVNTIDSVRRKGKGYTHGYPWTPCDWHKSAWSTQSTLAIGMFLSFKAVAASS